MSTNAKPTAAQARAIKAAHSAITHLSSATNWHDSGVWSEALRLERKQGLPGLLANGKIVEAWHKGAANPDTPVRDVYRMRPGYLMAYLLGVRHAVERSDHDYNGPMFADALQLCGPALEAFNAAADAWVNSSTR